MSRLKAGTMMTENVPATVTAKRRKRCPKCKQMVEVGETAVLTDDRYMNSKVQWFGRSYRRGAWHLWHPDCHAEVAR